MKNLTVSTSPHIHSNDSTQRIMLDVVIALVPAGIFGIIYFGMSAFLTILISVTTCLVTEAVIQKIQNKKVTINDFSAVVTGLLIAYTLPSTVPWWIPVVISVLAIGLVKQAFGGLGHNFMNPALAARAIAVASWPTIMTNYPIVDTISGATPLALLKESQAVTLTLTDMFMGNVGGCIGETSAFALLLGAAYLLVKKIINWRIPTAYMLTVAVLSLILQIPQHIFYYLLGGGLILGAFFMATDYSSSPITKKGQLIMGFGAGLLTVILRKYSGMPEGVSYAILIMNLVVPLIDRYTVPKIFGEAVKNA